MRGTQKAGYNHDIIASLSSLIIALHTKELKIELEECISLTVVSSENSVYSSSSFMLDYMRY